MKKKNAASPTGGQSKAAMLLLVAITLLTPRSWAQQKEFAKWPAGTSPKEIGKRVAERFVSGPHTNFGRSTPPAHITYPETVAWYGALTFAELSGDKDLTARLVSRFDSLLTNEPTLVPQPVNVDSTVFASVPLEIYIQTKQQK